MKASRKAAKLQANRPPIYTLKPERSTSQRLNDFLGLPSYNIPNLKMNNELSDATGIAGIAVDSYVGLVVLASSTTRAK